jgi:MFS family permease
VYLPMTALIIIAALVVGRLVTTVGARWLIFSGCVLFGGGLLLTTVTLSPHPSVLPLALTLALVGIGVGTTLVPVTASALSAVPAERSGMAASAANTSREIGAVTGVAVLGYLTISQLLSNFDSAYNTMAAREKLSPGLREFFLNYAHSKILTGGISGGPNLGVLGSHNLIVEMTDAAYSAFSDGLDIALYLSASLVLAAGLFAFVILGRKSPADDGSAAAYRTGAPGYGPGTPGYGPGTPGYGPGTPEYGPPGRV